MSQISSDEIKEEEKRQDMPRFRITYFYSNEIKYYR